jgi:hypothetical protein
MILESHNNLPATWMYFEPFEAAIRQPGKITALRVASTVTGDKTQFLTFRLHSRLWTNIAVVLQIQASRFCQA